MKKIRVISTLLLFSLLFISLSSCSKLINLKKTDSGDFYDKKNNVTYKAVSSEFEPKSYGEEYARWKIDGDDVIMYTVEGLDPGEWLYCLSLGTLYCASNITMPNPLTIDYNKVLICREEAQTWTLYTIDDVSKVTSIIINITDGETMTYPSTAATYSYVLKFETEQFPSLYYSVRYYEYSETEAGCFYFREDNHRCVKSNELFSKYVTGEE